MDSGSSSSIASKRPCIKSDRSRRTWTDHEELVLINALKELVATGWKSQNGFRPGYLAKVEADMKKHLPGTDIRALPHINSKIQGWKRNHQSLLGMMSSGVGWNSSTGMIETTDDNWNHIVMVDSNAKGMRYKKWILYEDWNEVFGNDRVSGANAEDVIEAVNELLTNEKSGNASIPTEGNDNFNEHFDDLEVNSNQHNKFRSSSKPSKKKWSHKDAHENEPLYELLGRMHASTEAKLDKIARFAGYEASIGEAKKDLYNILSKIPRLSIDEKLTACHLLVKNSECLEMFMGLPDEARARYIIRLLSGEFGL